MDQAKRLGEGKLFPLLMQFSLPAIIVMLVGALYNVIDRVFVGHSLGYLGIAGMTIALPIMLIVWAFGSLVGVGGASLVSIKLGEGDAEEAKRITGTALTLLIVIALAITAIGLSLLTPMLQILGTTAEVMPYARDYMFVFLAGVVIMVPGMGMNNFIRAEGQPGKALITMLLGPIVNIGLAPIFIFVLGWGMSGAALATVCAQGLSTIWVLSHFVSKKTALRFSFAQMQLQGKRVVSIVVLGLAPFFMQSLTGAVNFVLNTKIGEYAGDIGLSGIGTVTSIGALILMPIMGISQGMQPIIGYNYGAKAMKRVRECLIAALLVGTGIAVIAFIVTRLFPEQLIQVFNTENKELIRFGSYCMGLYMLCLPIVAVQTIGSGYFQAVGKGKEAMLLILARQILVFIPALYLMPLFFHLEGVLLAAPVADGAAFLLAGGWMLYEFAGLKKQEKVEEVVVEAN